MLGGCSKVHRMIGGCSKVHRMLGGCSKVNRMLGGCSKVNRMLGGCSKVHRMLGGCSKVHRMPGGCSKSKGTVCISRKLNRVPGRPSNVSDKVAPEERVSVSSFVLPLNKLLQYNKILNYIIGVSLTKP
jgi:hypothetical protein